MDGTDGLILSFVVEPRAKAAPRTPPLGAARWIQAALPATPPRTCEQNWFAICITVVGSELGGCPGSIARACPCGVSAGRALEFGILVGCCVAA